MRIEDIRSGLLTFTSTYAYNAGRMNLIPVGGFEVILDYCHNVASYEAIKGFLTSMKGKRRIGVMGVPGDRREEDVVAMARSAATCFDHFILRDDLLRGRQPGEFPALFHKTLVECGIDPSRIETVLPEVEAVDRALQLAKKDEVVVVFCAEVEDAYHRIIEFKKAVEGT
jgi:cyanophycin synthetase